MLKKRPDSVLIYADSDHNADQLYFSGIFVPDSFISFNIGKTRIGVASALEFSRMSGQSSFDTVLSLEDLMERARKRFKNKEAGVSEVIRVIAEKFKIKRFKIPFDFPAGLALKLKEEGIRLKVAPGALFPEREFKTAKEARYIKEGNAASARGIRAAEKVLRASEIKNGVIHYQNRPLTSERLRQVIDTACLEVGAIASHTIVAGGDQACDPHCVGSGILRAGKLIIVDVFPRVSRTGYHGDMTRTFLKGKASEAQIKLVDAVRGAQEEALSLIRDGETGKTVHARVVAKLGQSGFKTEKTKKGYVGFFHGTGHGLGLEVHEPPRISPRGSILKTGQVVTVEPGLYYPGLGACRIEDVVWVTDSGYELLSKCHYRWRIR